MHIQHGHTGIHRGDVAVCHVGSHGAAAALINLAQSCNLPDDTGVVQGSADMTHHLCGCVGCAALAAAAGVLADGDTVVQGGVVALVAGLGEVGIIGIGNVRGQAEGIGEVKNKL